MPIPKKKGGERILGIPTVSDRIAQMVIKQMFEPIIEKIFCVDSYGYRPNKSALDAVGVTRERCWKYNWVLEFDIKGLFDNINHELLMKAVRKHTNNKCIILYIERWLKAPIQTKAGILEGRTRGVPQGGVISPLLSNLFMHYVFDVWMQRSYKDIPWCRYADDGLAHFKTESEAQKLFIALRQRLKECDLELHSDKTKIVYCKDGSRKGKYPNMEFEFLGYSFRRRIAKNSKRNTIFLNFTPAVSKSALKLMCATTRKWGLRNRTDLNLRDIANMYNPILRGWITYYGRYSRSALYPVLRHFNKTIISWIMRKFKRFKGHKTRATKFLEIIAKRDPKLFAHWKIGMIGAFT